jgi:transcriptional regulator with XRE-family HTH domain
MALAMVPADAKPRDEIDQDLLGHYIALLMDRVELPPVLAFQNGDDTILLADGFHRYYAHKGVGAKTIAVDLQHGDRLDAIRASLQANATHGQPRNAATLQRAYGLAIKHELVDPADIKAVSDVLQCSQRAAYELTEDAREDRKKAEKSIALQLHARGLSFRQIADKLGVGSPQTIKNWVSKLGSLPEMDSGPELLDQATLDKIAKAIREHAKEEVRPEVEAQVRDEIALLRKQFEQQIAELRQQMEDDRQAQAEVEPEIVEVEHAIADALDTDEEKQAKIQEGIRQFKDEDAARRPWNDCWNAVEAVEALDLDALRDRPYPPFEQKLVARLQEAARKLSAIWLITERSR